MACALKMNFGICASKDEIFARNVIPQPHPEIQCMISNSLSISRYFKFPITFYIPYLHIEFEEWVIFFLMNGILRHPCILLSIFSRYFVVLKDVRLH